MARFSTVDAERLEAYGARLEAIADVLREVVLQTPPNMTEGGLLAALPELLKAGALGRKLSRLDLTARRDLVALFAQSAGDWLDGWFQSDPIKAAFGFDGVVGAYASPYTPGTAYVLLHHVFGEVNGKKGAWGHAIGGMGGHHPGHGPGLRGPGRGHPHRVHDRRDPDRRGPRGRRRHPGGRTCSGRARWSPTCTPS